MLPSQHLIKLAKEYPNAWKLVEVFRAGRGVDLPAWYAVISDDQKTNHIDLLSAKNIRMF